MADTIGAHLTLENRLSMTEKNISTLMKEIYKTQKLASKASIDTSHMYKIVRQLHKEHETIMQLNGHETLLTTIDKLME